jgi:Flp pilus assembly protein TadB
LGKRSRKRSVAGETRSTAKGYERSRERNEAIRQSLEPLPQGERPGAVSVAAILAAVMALANTIAALAGAGLGSSALSFTILSNAVLIACAFGMWFGARYWAVLGFMVVLVFQILTLCAAVVVVEKWWVGLIVVVVIGLLGWMFWKLIRALARIQMPERPSASPR